MVVLKRQKVRFRRKNIETLRKARFNFKTTIKFIVLALLVGGIGFAFVGFKYLFFETGYFIVKGIDVRLYNDKGVLSRRSLNEISDARIVGTNIFVVDLNALRERIDASHPEFKDVVVRRVLPNKLVMQARLRKPIAQIRSDRYYFMDEGGILLPDVKNFPDPQLPVITGINANLAKVKANSFSRFDKERIDKALFIITEMRSIKGLSQYRLKLVDITDPGNFSFFLEGSNVEIKIGNSDFDARIKLLATLLGQVGEDVDKFKYIDLRFEDPIIGPR